MNFTVELNEGEIQALKQLHHGKTTAPDFERRLREARTTFPTGYVSQEDIQSALELRDIQGVEVDIEDVRACADWQQSIEGIWLDTLNTWIDEQRAEWADPDPFNPRRDIPPRDMNAPMKGF